MYLPWATVVAFALAHPTAHAINLNIDFGDDYGVPSSSYGAAAGQTGTWNEILSLGVSNLVDLGGNATSVTLDANADTMSGNFGSPTTDPGRLRADNFYSANGSSWTILLSNLDNGTYSVYYYAPIHPSVVTGSFTVNGSAVSSIDGSDSDSMNQGTDWQVLTGVAVTDGTLTLASTSSSSFRGLSGLQLVSSPVPEPFTMGLAGLALAAAARRRLRKSA